MAKIKFAYQSRTFEANRFLEELQKNCLKARDAVGIEFIRHLLARVPVWSGAAQATLLPLSELIESSKLTIPNKPLKTDYTDSQHGVEAGAAHGLGFPPSTKGKYGFTYAQSLQHFTQLEQEEWHALEGAQKIIEEFLIKNGQKIFPKLKNHFHHFKG